MAKIKPDAGKEPQSIDDECTGERPRFLVDAMCHPLVSWLRIFDYDTVAALELGQSPTDAEIITRAVEDGRILVTRDRALTDVAAGRNLKVVQVEGNETMGHLRHLVKELGIDTTPKSSRCTVCNGRLAVAGEKEITDDIALRVAREGMEVWRCRDCGQHYWRGSQWASIERFIRDISRV
jgi:uncharacterized protein with PIN domain